MERFNLDELEEKVKLLKAGECIPLLLSKEEWSAIEYISFLKPSIESLFAALMKGNLENCSKDRMLELVSVYSDVLKQQSMIIRQSMYNILGDDLYKYICHPDNHYYYQYDEVYKAIMLSKRASNCKC